MFKEILDKNQKEPEEMSQKVDTPQEKPTEPEEKKPAKAKKAAKPKKVKEPSKKIKKEPKPKVPKTKKSPKKEEKEESTLEPMTEESSPSKMNMVLEDDKEMTDETSLDLPSKKRTTEVLPLNSFDHLLKEFGDKETLSEIK